ncbi:MAG: TIGR00730 family Rossman fold protein [Clostridia bacterium]|nr:TIGR00730 family Rossman fold protein [Clostridia bacterium]
MLICVFGASSTDLEKEYYDEAYALGRTIAESGNGIVFGGGNQGLMGSVVRGVESGNGYSLGVAPRFFDKPDILYSSCSEFIFTDTMRERKQIMEDRADAFIALPGGIGTYEELLEVLTLKQLGQTDKPIVIYNFKGYFNEFLAMIDSAVEKGFMKKEALRIFTVSDNPKSAVEAILREKENPLDVLHLKNI